MELLEPTFITISVTVLAAAVLLFTLLALRQRQGARRGAARGEATDTLQGWPPEPARVLTVHERQAYELLRRSLPGFMVLAQVPLARFLRVPTRHSYSEWLRRVGSLNADLLLCDAGSRVLAVIDIRTAQETTRSRKRHERMGRVLKAAGIAVHVWREGSLPSAAEVRTVIGAALEMRHPTKATPSRPMPLIPVAEMEEVLAAGDLAAQDMSMEPVPSAFFEELDSAHGQLSKA